MNDFSYEYINYSHYLQTGDIDDIHSGFGPEQVAGSGSTAVSEENGDAK